MSKGKLIFVCLITIIFIILGYVKYKNIQEKKSKEMPPEKPGGKTIKADAIVVQYTKLDNEISSNGNILAQDEVQLQPEVSGRVIQLNIQEGSMVSKGTLLMKISDADLRAQLGKVKSQLAVAQSNVKRLSELLKINGVSQSDYDLAENQVSTLKADMVLLEVQIAKTELRAPFTGKLGLRNISVGAYVTPNTIIATIQNIHQLKLDLSIPERYAGLVQKGNKMDCTVDGISAPFQSQVIATDPQIDANTRNLKVRAVILNPNTHLIPGSYVRVALKLNETPDAIMIPSNAIIPDDKANKVVVVENGKAQFVPLTLGIRSSSDVQVLNGLKIRDTVLVTGLLQAKPNMNIKINKIVSTNPTKSN